MPEKVTDPDGQLTEVYATCSLDLKMKSEKKQAEEKKSYKTSISGSWEIIHQFCSKFDGIQLLAPAELNGTGIILLKTLIKQTSLLP